MGVLNDKVLNNSSVLPVNKYKYLTYPDLYLVPCSLIEEEDTVKLHFDYEGLLPVKEAKFDELEQIKMLLNCSGIISLCDRYTFSMNPDNLCVDLNQKVMVVDRDFGTKETSAFIAEYKSLIGSVINPKYSYEDYLNGGNDLLNKSKVLSDFTSLDTVEAVREKLLELYEIRKNDIKNNYELVRKGTNSYAKILIPVLAGLLVLSLLAFGYFFFYENRFQSRIIEANEAYLNNDYLTVQTTLEGISVDKLPYMSKYILAVSYLKSADLSLEEKTNELNRITTKTDELLFEYWIYIGRLDYENAIDSALRLNSDSHLFYAYMSYRNFVNSDRSMSGDEKSALLADLDSKISSLSESIKTAQSAEVTETEEPEATVASEDTDNGELVNPFDATPETEVPETAAETADATEDSSEPESSEKN